MKHLTSVQIAKLAARKGVRVIAVENFLGTLGPSDDLESARANLQADARSYKWNAATQNAILAGIVLASKA